MDNHFHNNTARIGGGADISGTTIVTNNEFLNNNGENYGGGLYIDSGDSKIIDNRFIDNSALLDGGGLAINAGGEATISGNIFNGNSVYLFPTEPDIGGGGLSILISDRDVIL